MEDPLIEINKKLDVLMEHIGCKVSKENYLNMSDEEKDIKDEADMIKAKGIE